MPLELFIGRTAAAKVTRLWALRLCLRPPLSSSSSRQRYLDAKSSKFLPSPGTLNARHRKAIQKRKRERER
jgi:hypothetical protein